MCRARWEAFLRRVRKGGDHWSMTRALSFKDVAGKSCRHRRYDGKRCTLRGELNEARQMAIAGDHSSARSFNNSSGKAIPRRSGESVRLIETI